MKDVKKEYPLRNYTLYLWGDTYRNKEDGKMYGELFFKGNLIGFDSNTFEPIWENPWPRQLESKYEKMPDFSASYIRQIFIDACSMSGILTEETDRYNLLHAKRFTWNSPNDEDEEDYWRRAHAFCEEYQLEEAYLNFEFWYRVLIAKQWCITNNFPFTNKENFISFLEFPDPYIGREFDDEDD